MNTDLRSSPDSHTLGIAAGILSAACFGLTSALVNVVANAVPATEVTFVRGLIGLVLITPFVFHRLPTLVRRDALSVWVRSVSGAVSILCFSWNLQHTDVGTANILFNLSLILVLFADHVTGQTHAGWRSLVSVLLVVGGIAVYWLGNEIMPGAEVLTVGCAGAVAATIAYTALSKASRKNDPWLIVWTVSLMSIPVSLFAKAGSWAVPSASSSLLLVAIALGSLLAHYLLNVSFAKLSLPIATALGPSSIVWSVLILALVQSSMPTPHALLGVLIYAVGLGWLIAESRKEVNEKVVGG